MLEIAVGLSLRRNSLFARIPACGRPQKMFALAESLTTVTSAKIIVIASITFYLK
jgi:hypothetical protein